MERLTDRKTAAELKENAEKLRATGLEPTISDLRYIKLAEYENHDEQTNRDEQTNHKEKGYCKDCAYSEFRGMWLICNKYNKYPVLYYNCCDDFIPQNIDYTERR